MPFITREAVTTAIKEVVAEAGEDHVYPFRDADRRCFYRDGETPLCIVGAVLAKVLSPEDFLQLVPDMKGPDGVEPYAPVADALILYENDPAFTSPTIRTESAVRHGLRGAQSLQDQGQKWGYALEAYLRWVEES
jgi:hypothetical protein